MPDFRLQQSFPIASVIEASQRKAQLENQFHNQNTELFNQSLAAIGTIGQSLLDRKKRMAQAMLLSQQPEVQDMLSGGDRTVAEGPAGPVRLDQTAQGGVGVEPKQNAPALPPNQAALLLEGQNPLAVLKQAFERKQKTIPQMVEETIYKKDASGNIIGTETRRVPRGSKSTVVGPQPIRQTPPMSPDRAEFKIIDTFNANPQVRKQQQAIDGAIAVRELALSGNPIAASAIPTYMARASGEVGNLSEADKAPFGGSSAILERLEAALTQKAIGQLSPENQQFLVDLSNIMEKNAEKNLDRKAREMSKQYGTGRIGLKPDDIFKSLRPNSQYEEPKSDGIEPPKEPESKDVLKVGGTFNGQKIIGVRLKKS